MPEAPLQPLLHLADRAGARPGTAPFPAAMVGRERRAVLANFPDVALGLHALYPPVRRSLSLPVKLPEQLRGGPVRLWATGAGIDIDSQEARLLETPGAEVEMHLALPELPQGKVANVSFTGRRGPLERVHQTEPFTVPPGARLRLEIGVDESEWPPDLPAVTFRLTAIDEHRPWWRPAMGPAVLLRARLDPRADPAERRWLAHDLDLSGYAGRRIRLRFESGPERETPGTPFVYPVWGDPTLWAPDPRARARRNVLLVSLDTLRADHLGCYGYARPTSPTIDRRLAGEGALFERAYAAFPITHASHMTVFTALPPCVHGIGVTRTELAADVSTLPQVVRAAGWATAAFTEDGALGFGLGFGRGFGTYVENTEVSTSAERTFGDALAWIRHQGDTRWLAFVHTYQVHRPYEPPPGYLERVASGHATDEASILAARYDGEIRYTDDLLATFLEGLAGAGVLDDTVVVVFSDHGEHFGEHGRLGHANSLYDELLHVPLFVRAPGLVPAGTRVPEPVGLIDVMPTVLELIGLPGPERMQGRSLVPLLQGRALPEVPLFAELPVQHLVSVRRGPHKWILNEKTAELELFGDADGVPDGAVGAALLRDYRARCRGGSPESGPPAIDSLDPAVREKLRALGYIE